MNKDLRIRELEEELALKNEEVNKLERNLSSVRESETILRKEIYKYEELINSSSSLITFLRGADHVIEFANPPIRNVWGKGDDVVGKPLFEVLPEVREQGIEDYLTQVYHEGIPYHAESLPVEHNIDGKMLKSYFDFSYMPQYDIKGKITGVGVIAKDVTQRVLLHQQIKKSEKEFRELVEFMPHKISITDAEGNTLFYNKSWLDFAGMNLLELLDKSWISLLHPDQVAMAEGKIKDCLKTGEDLELEVQLKNRNGEYKWHLCRATAIKDEDGNITSWLSSSTEIQKLKEEEKRKEDFLKLVSHELKTPVTSIKGYIQLMQSIIPNNNGNEVNQVRPYLKRIGNQVERLIRLISEMLDLSRIELNEMELNKEDFSLNDQVSNILEDFSYTHKEVQIELEHDFECRVHADKDRIGQVIINFINNALKYSPESNRVQVRVYRSDNDKAAVSVKDYGIGIREEDIKKIFNRFYRVSGKNDNTYSGFGIGLYLSNEIIERHNGNIFVESNPGEGSEFTFTLPLN